MLHITHIDNSRFAYTVSGKLSMTELAVYYQRLDEQFRHCGKLDLEATVPRFSGYTSLRAFITFLRHEPELLHKVATYTARTNNLFLRAAIRTLDLLIPCVRFTTEPLDTGTPLGSSKQPDLRAERA